MGWCISKRCYFLIFGLLLGPLCNGLSAKDTSDASIACDETSQFPCRNDPSICIALERVRDGVPDCPDKSDEECNKEEEFQCQSIFQCIPKTRFHDGWPDCDDGTDEECGRGQHRCMCGLPHCIEGHKVKDGVKDCDDGSDEEDHRNSTKPCPEGVRLQDLMAVEKRRRKRQANIHKLEMAPSTESSSTYKQTIVSKYAEFHGLPSTLVSSNEKKKKDRKYSEYSKVNPTKTRMKISAKVESYGSLNSGKIYQTAVNEPMSSVSLLETIFVSPIKEKDKIIKLKTEDPENKVLLKKKSNSYRFPIRNKFFADFLFIQFLRFPVKNISDVTLKNNSKSNDIWNMKNFEKTQKKHSRWPNSERKTYIENESGKHLEEKSDFIVSAFQPRKLLFAETTERTTPKKVDAYAALVLALREKVWLEKNKSASEESEIPLVTSSNFPYTPQQSLYPTGVVMSVTGTDVTDDKTTEWTTLVEGTFISGTYAHVVKSTSKIFFTVTKSHTDNNNPSSVTSDFLNVIEPTTTVEDTGISKTPLLPDSQLLSNTDDISVSFAMTSKNMILSSSVAEDKMSSQILHEELNTRNVITDSNESFVENMQENNIPVVVDEDFVSVVTNTLYSQNTPAFISSSLSPSFTTEQSLTDDSNSAYHDTLKINEIFTLPLNDSNSAEPHSTSIGIFTGITTAESNFKSFKNAEENLNKSTEENIFNPINTNESEIEIFSEKPFTSFSSIKPVDDKSKSNDSTLLVIVEKSEKEKKEFTTQQNLGNSLVVGMISNSNEMSLLSDINHKNLEINATEINLNVNNSLKYLLPNVSSETKNDSNSMLKVNNNHVDVNSSPTEDLKEIILSTSTKDIYDFTNTVSLISSDKANKSKILFVDRDYSGSSVHLESSMRTMEYILPSVEMENIFSSLTPSMISVTTNLNLDSSSVQETKIRDSKESKRVKRVVNEKVTVLNADGRIVTTNVHAVLSPVTHYTTSTYYTTVLVPGGGSSILSHVHVESSIAVPRVGGTYRPISTPYHDADYHRDNCCEDTGYTPGHGVHITRVRDPHGTDEYHTVAIPYDVVRPTDITHRTTYTYYTTRYRSGTSYVDTRKVTETNVTPIPIHGTESYPRHHHNHVGTVGYHAETHPIGDVHYVTHKTTYTYHTTHFSRGTPVVNTREETETNITPLHTHYSHTVHRPVTRVTVQSIPTRYPVYVDRIDTSLHRPDRITHRTTYTYHTTVFRHGTPVITTREETVTNVTPIPTYRPTRPVATVQHATRFQTPYIRTLYDTSSLHAHNDPYITHYTTFTYYTTVYRGGTSHIDSRKETVTNITPNPTFEYPRITRTRVVHTDRIGGHTISTYYDEECPVCVYEDHLHNIPRNDDTRRRSYVNTVITPREPIAPSTVTHFSTYTYITTVLPRDTAPEFRTREHTVTGIYSNVVLPSLAGTPVSRQRELTFGERIRSKRTVSSYPESISETQLFKLTRIHNINSTTIRSQTGRTNRGGRRLVVNTPKLSIETTNAIHLTSIPVKLQSIDVKGIGNDVSDKVHYTQEIKPTDVTFFSTYTYFTTELSNGMPVVKSREHTVTEILTGVIVPTIASLRRTHAISLSPSLNNYQNFRRQRSVTEKKKELKNFLKDLKERSFYPRKLLSVNNTENVLSDATDDLFAEGAEQIHRIAATPTTHYTTYTYYATVLKPGGSKVVETSTKVSSSVYYPNARTFNTHVYVNEPHRNENRESRSCSNCPAHNNPHNVLRIVKPHVNNDALTNKVKNEYHSRSPYRPSFATTVRGPFYETVYHTLNKVECNTCNYQATRYKNHQSGHQNPGQYINRPHAANNPAKRVFTHGRKIQNEEKDFIASEVKPTHVTYYSTYTYFTTELKDGHPVVKSREHTVTELLTNVIVPTVVSLNRVPHTRLYRQRRSTNFLKNALEDSFKENRDQENEITDFLEEAKKENTLNSKENLFISDNNLPFMESFSDENIQPSWTVSDLDFLSSNNFLEVKNSVSLSVTSTLQFKSPGESEVAFDLQFFGKEKESSHAPSYPIFSNVVTPLTKIEYENQFHLPLKAKRKILGIEDGEENSENLRSTKKLYDENSNNISKYGNLDTNLEDTVDTELRADDFRVENVSANIYNNSTETLFDFTRNNQINNDYKEYLKYLGSSFFFPSKTRNHIDLYTVRNSVKKNYNDVITLEKMINPTVEAFAGLKQTTKSSDVNFEEEFNKLGPLSTVTSEVSRNGKVTKFTKTIHGTYINGVYAQIAQTESEILSTPLTSDLRLLDSSPVYLPNRFSGLVTTKISKITRGPVAVHLTTEIHGTFVGGAYAQTARIYTSYQPLSAVSVKETSRQRISTSKPALYLSTTKKTGVLTSRVLKSKIEDGTTFLLVSELHGTHIGGAYAHLVTYVTKTISSTSSIKNTKLISDESALLGKHKLEKLDTGLITDSVRDKIVEGVTTRYHYEVYGTFLDGTYAHVPSIKTEIIFPTTSDDSHVNSLSNGFLKTFLESNMKTFHSEMRDEGMEFTGRNIRDNITPTLSFVTDDLKTGLIQASNRIHVINGTTTRHVYEVYGTFLSGTYAHVPSISVEIIKPSLTISSSTNFYKSDKFEDINAFVGNKESVFYNNLKTNYFYSTLLPITDDAPVITDFDEEIDITANDTFDVRDRLIANINDEVLKISEPNKEKDTSAASVLTSEALQKSSAVPRSPREKRESINLNQDSFLRSSIDENKLKSVHAVPDEPSATTPLPKSVLNHFTHVTHSSVKDKFEEATRINKQEKFRDQIYKTHLQKCSPSLPYNINESTKKVLSRLKRSLFGQKSSSVFKKRFGVTSTDARKFGSSSSKSGFSKHSSVNSRSYIRPTTSSAITFSRESFRRQSNYFLPRSRNKSHQRPVILPSLISSERHLPMTSTVSKKYEDNFKGTDKKDSDIDSDEEYLDVSEAVIQSVTDQSVSSLIRRSRIMNLLRPSKIPKFTSRGSYPVTPRSKKPFTVQATLTTNSPVRSSRHYNSRSSRNKEVKIKPTPTTASAIIESETSKRRFTLTTSFKMKQTDSYIEIPDDMNNLQDDSNLQKRKSKDRNVIAGSQRRNRGSSSKSAAKSNDNELQLDKPRTLPLPPFGRSRGFKRPPKFDPRTLKDAHAATPATSTIIYVTKNRPEPLNEDKNDSDLYETISKNRPVTVTEIITTIKTLPIHLGVRTSFATITTTAYSTSTIQPEDLTIITIGGHIKTLVSSNIGFPDINLPPEKQKTLVTEVILTTKEIESTSLLAIKVGYGTRTDTVIAKEILTTLTTQVNTLFESHSHTHSIQQPYPFYTNPYFPQPADNSDFSLSLTENSFVSTQEVVSTTIVPLRLNGKEILTTLVSTSTLESIVVETSTVKIPQPHTPPLHPYIFPQPVFILPSVTTEITLQFTVPNGEIISLVTTLTIPLMPTQSNARFVRSVPTEVTPTIFDKYMNTKEGSFFFNEPRVSFLQHTRHKNTVIDLQSSLNSFTSNLHMSESDTVTCKTHSLPYEKPTKDASSAKFMSDIVNLKSKSRQVYIKNAKKVGEKSFNIFKKRNLLQFNSDTETKHAFIKFDDFDEGEEYDKSETVPQQMNNTTYSSAQDDIMYFPALTDPLFPVGAGYIDDGLGRPIPSIRVVPTRRAYVRRIRPDGIPQETDVAPTVFGLRQASQNLFPQRPIINRPFLSPNTYVNNYQEGGLPFQDQNLRNQFRRPEFGDNNIPPQSRRVIRLRRPVNPATTQQPDLLNRKPIINSAAENDYKPLRARGPAITPHSSVILDSREITDNNQKPKLTENNILSRPKISDEIPLTYYTTFTYMTTFLNGPSTAYSTREAVVSNIATETLNPKLIELIRLRGGFTTTQGVQTAVPLGSRSQGATTTVVNLASRVQVFNSDIYYNRHNSPLLEDTPRQNMDNSQLKKVNDKNSVINTLPITEVATLPKTYYTHFTYFYTFHDGDKSTLSQRIETLSNIVTEAEPFLVQSYTNTIDGSGYLTLSPEKEVVNLGSRDVDGTKTEVNLELRTLVHFDKLRNVVIDRGYISPSLVEILPTETSDLSNNYLEPGDAEVQDQRTYPQTLSIQPSFASDSESQQIRKPSNNLEATPEIPRNIQVARTRPLRGPLRVASTKVQRAGTLRSGEFVPRPGVRVRIKPLITRLNKQTSPNQNLLTSSEVSFDSTRNHQKDSPYYEDATTDDPDDDSEEEETAEDESDYEESDYLTTPGEEEITEPAKEIQSSSGRKRLKITVRRPQSPSSSRTNSRFVLPSRTRPRFYVVTRTGTPGSGSVRPVNRPVSVKVSRRLRPSDDSQYQTYTTVTSVPVIFGLSTTYRNAIVTSSSLVEPEGAVSSIKPSKTVVFTYFTTTTFTVPYTLNGRTTFTTIEETNSRIATETVDADADLSFVTTTTLDDYFDESSPTGPTFEEDETPQTLSPVQVYGRPHTFGNQLNFGSRVNLVTKVSNGVTLIVASDGSNEPSEYQISSTRTLEPTTLTDALLMTDKGKTTVFEPRTFFTTFTYFTTFYSGGFPTISTSEQVVTNVYTVPVTHTVKDVSTSITPTPITFIDTTEQLVSTTLYTTHTFYATLFNGTESFVTPLEELQPVVISSTETFTVTRTFLSTPSAHLATTTQAIDIEPTATTTTVYRTQTNYVTLFRGTESIISPLEEIVSDVLTLTPDKDFETATVSPDTKETYVTRTIQATNTHYITLFSGGHSILSSITEVAPTVITELVKKPEDSSQSVLLESTRSQINVAIEPSTTATTTFISSSIDDIQPTFQDLVPSVRTEYTTLTYFTTLFKDSSTILSSREEVATSYITLFVPMPLPGATSQPNDNIPLKSSSFQESNKENMLTPSETILVHLSPTSEVLTFYTTYTYYTTLFRGTETIISDSETVVTQYVTIETTPTEYILPSSSATSVPSLSVSETLSDTADVRVEPINVSTINLGDSVVTKILSTLPNEESNLEIMSDERIIGESTAVESEATAPSVLTGTPTTDANGATHILFTDFIVPSSTESPSTPSRSSDFSLQETPSLPENILSSETVIKASSTRKRFGTSSIRLTTSKRYSSDKPSTRVPASDLATTRLTDVNVATHLTLHPTSTYQSGSSQTLGIKPGAVIDLSDVLGNTNFVGNLGETIKGIVNLIAASGNRGRNTTVASEFPSKGQGIAPPSGGVTISNAEEPLYIPIGAIGRNTQNLGPTRTVLNSVLLQPSTIIRGFTPVMSKAGSHNGMDVHKNVDVPLKAEEDRLSRVKTGLVFGSDTIFIEPTRASSNEQFRGITSMFDSNGGIFLVSNGEILQSSKVDFKSPSHMATPITSESTSIITGIETIFFGLPDGRKPPHFSTRVIQGSLDTSSIVGVETIFFDSAGPMSNTVQRISTGETTIFGSIPVTLLSHITRGSGSSPTTQTTAGATTIFFPIPEERPSSPGTRYVTSVESVTLTLTLTTSSVYHTKDTPVTVTSVFTTTIPPRTFVSTIIGSRTILGTQPEPTEALQVIPTMRPSESTTTVTTTTLIFNSIATTVVRTLVIPTHAIQPTGIVPGSAKTSLVEGNRGNDDSSLNKRLRVTSPKSTTRKPIQLFKSPNRPTEATTPKAARAGPVLKLFPTKPPTTTTDSPPKTTTKTNGFRKPGKALVPVTDGCPRECNFKNKEVCKQNEDRSWSCQCRPGFFKKEGSDECRDVKSFVVLVRVLKMGGNDVTFNEVLSNNLSEEYQNLTTTARKAVDDAYKTSAVGDSYVSANVLSVSEAGKTPQEGVLVNLTVQVSADGPASEEVLKEQLVQSLQASASEVELSNATVVSPIIQRIEDVQDFDECSEDNYNDCSRSAVCANLPGTYTCECKEGYQDLEPQLPGRICSGEIKDCDYCNNRGVCIMTEDDQKFCRCYRMYLGKQCEINGLVLAIALPIALALLILTMFCLLCGCRKLRRRKAQKPKQGGNNNVFKNMVPPLAGTLDRKAMIVDSSSESSGEHARHNHGYDAFGDESGNLSLKRSGRSRSMDDQISSDYPVPTVLIPRARHQHPKQVNPSTQKAQYRSRDSYMDQW